MKRSYLQLRVGRMLPAGVRARGWALRAMALLLGCATLPCAGALGQTATVQKAPGLALQAQQARDSNQLEEAAKLYASALQQRPAWAEGWWDLGGVQYKLQRFAPGSESYRHVTLLNPRDGAAFALKGLCEYEVGRYAQALQDLGHGGSLGTGEDNELTPVILFHVALLLTREGEFERSRDQLAMFVASGNHTPDTVLALGLSTLRMPLAPPELPAAKRDMVMQAGEAEWQFLAHDVESAKTQYAALVAAYPNEPNVHFAYGTYLLDSDPQLAFEEFKKELAISPHHTAARLQVAFFDLEQGDAEAAMKLAEEVLPSDPKDYRVHLVMGRSLLQMNESAKAVRELKLAAGLSPDDFEPRFYLAQAYRKLGDKENATREQAEFDRLKSADNRQTSIAGWWYFAGEYYNKRRFPEARDALKKITAQNPKDSNAWAMMGLCDYELADYTDALAHLTQATQVGVPSDLEMESALHYYRALLLNKVGKFDDSLAELGWFASKGPAKPQTIEAVGINTLRMKLLPKEIPAGQHELVMKAGAAAWVFNLGHPGEAKGLFEALLTVYPDEANLHYHYAMCLAGMNDADSARRELARVLELDPSYGDAEAQLAFLDLKSGATAEALTEAEAAVKLMPDGFAAHNALGWALLADGRAAQAIDEMKAAVALAPELPVNHFSLAQAYKAAGNSADAARERALFESLKQGFVASGAAAK